MVNKKFVIRDNNLGKTISIDAMVDAVDIEELLQKKYGYIFKSMNENGYALNRHHCTYFNEIVYEKMVVGFCAYTITNNVSNLTLVASYILPEFRAKGLFFDEINRIFTSDKSISIYEVSPFIVDLLVKYGFARKLDEGFIVSSINFEIPSSSITHTLNQEKIKYDDYIYSTNFYDTMMESTIILVNEEIMYLSQWKNRENKEILSIDQNYYEKMIKVIRERKKEINHYLKLVKSDCEDEKFDDKTFSTRLSYEDEHDSGKINILDNVNNKKKKKHSFNNLENLNYEKYTLAYKDAAIYDFIKKFKNNQNIELTNSIIEIDHDFKNDYLKRTVLEEGYISNHVSEDNKSEYVENLKVSQLKEILKDNDLPINGNKKKLIKRVMDYVPAYNLKETTYHITQKGKAFLENNKQIFFFNKFLKKYYYYEFAKYYELYKMPLNDVCIKFLEDHLEKSVEKRDFDAYIDSATTLAYMNKLYGDNELALYYELKIFIIRLNPVYLDEELYSYYQPIQEKNIENIKTILFEQSINLKYEFNNAWNLKEFDGIIIPENKCLNILNKMLAGEDRDFMNENIREIYLQKVKTNHDKLDKTKQSTLDKFLKKK